MIPLHERSERWFNSDFPFCLRIDKLCNNILPHGHNFIEFNYTFQGCGIEKINGISHELKPGTLTLLFPHQIHEIIPDPNNHINMYVGGFGLEFFFDENDSILSVNQLLLNRQYELSSYHYFKPGTSNKVIDLLHQMHNEILNNLAWNQIMFKIKLIELFIIFNRERMTGTKRLKNISLRNRNSSIEKIVQYVYKNSHENISLESLSEMFYISIPHISSAFKQFIGENFHSFLEKIRMAHACSLLISSKMSITEIAFEVGFKSYTTFSRVFLETMKMSPTKYKRAGYLSYDTMNI